MQKSGSFTNKTCCGLTSLFVKSKTYFCCCDFANKQINKNSYRLYSIGRTQNIPENVCGFGNGTPNQWAPTKNVPVYYDKLINSSSEQNILSNKEFYKLLNDVYIYIYICFFVFT